MKEELTKLWKEYLVELRRFNNLPINRKSYQKATFMSFMFWVENDYIDDLQWE